MRESLLKGNRKQKKAGKRKNMDIWFTLRDYAHSSLKKTEKASIKILEFFYSKIRIFELTVWGFSFNFMRLTLIVKTAEVQPFSNYKDLTRYLDKKVFFLHKTKLQVHPLFIVQQITTTNGLNFDGRKNLLVLEHLDI